MDTDNGFDIMPWLKTDLISGFSDLLDDRLADADLGNAAVTLNSSDLGVSLPAMPCVDFAADQVQAAADACRTPFRCGNHPCIC